MAREGPTAGGDDSSSAGRETSGGSNRVESAGHGGTAGRTRSAESGGSSGSTESRESAGSGERPEEYPLPPGPDGYPIVGNTLDLLSDPFAFFDELAAYGDVVRYRSGPWRFTALMHPDHVERVLVQEPWRFERWSFTDVGLEFASEGLLETGGAQWHRQREVIQPAFTTERVRSYGDAMVRRAEALADGWTDGREIALDEEFSGLTLRILAEALFDVRVDPGADDQAIPRAARVINERSGPSRNLSMFLPDWLPTPGKRRYERAIAEVHERTDELVEQRRAGRSVGGDVGGLPGEDLLSLLLYAEGPDGETLSEREIRENLLTFMFAGHETTALGLTYAFLLLAEHDEAAARLRQELDAVLNGRSPTVGDLPALEYTEGVVREALRLYPPAFVLFRRATEDAAIGGYRIPEGTILSLPQFRLHEDPRFWDAPSAFRPERWLADRDRPEYAYFPFGGGPRHCIGMRFAMLELQLVVATLARRFDATLLSDPDPEFAPGATLRPSEPVRVRLLRLEDG